MSAKVLAGVGGVMLFLLALALAAPSPTLTVSIPAGHEGVLYERLAGGTNVQRAYDEGLHFLWPWNSMYVYDARFQTRSATFATRTRDGTNLTVVVAVRFRAVRRNMPLLHKYIGPDYVERLILPGLGARVREAIAFHTLEEVYSTKRLEIQMEIRNAMRQQFQMDPESDTLLQRVEFLEIGEVFLHDVEVAGPGCTSDRASGEMQPTGL